MKHLLVFKHIVVCVLISCGLMSCQTVYYTTTSVQTLNPPTKNINLPDTANIAIVALLNNADSVEITNVAISLKNRLEASPKYESYIFPVYTVKAEADNLTDEQISDIRDDSKADYLIVVEYFDFEIDEKIKEQRHYDYQTQITVATTYKALFKIYDTRRLALIDSNSVNDTLLMVSNINSWETAVVLPNTNRKTVASAVIENMTELYSQRIAPYWQEESRYYYLEPKIRNSQMYIENEEWNKAMNIWLEYVDDSDKTLAAVCCFNMAVGCEMLGEYELALKWLEQINRKNPKYFWEEYQRVIEKRIAEKQIIDKTFK